MFRITECLSLGPFASRSRAEQLLAAGVTHVLNVSDSPNEVSAAAGFASVAWVPMSDSRRLQPATMLRALDTLHELASASESQVYVHCVAGLVRAPTILWLYLIALGVPARDARDWIESRSKMANAGSSRMTDREHLLLAQMHGLSHYFPHPRPNLIVPFPLDEESPNRGLTPPACLGEG
jgi:protein-tyrosine phosphatase